MACYCHLTFLSLVGFWATPSFLLTLYILCTYQVKAPQGEKSEWEEVTPHIGDL